MTFILDIPGDGEKPEEFQALRKFFDAYKDYLKALGDRLPASIREFALSTWYYDYQDSKCPYDAWLESAKIVEPAEGEHGLQRSIDFEIRLLGPYHDGHIIFSYTNVANYSLVLPAVNERIKYAGHDGWQVDEVRLSNRNTVIHEILFKSGARWLIEADSIVYSWVPLTETKS